MSIPWTDQENHQPIVKVEVVVPCFRQGSYLCSLLRSIASSTSLPHRVIVVDDGSPDRLTHLALEQLRPVSATQDVDVIRMPTNSGGVGTPRNVGLRHCQAEYVLFLDGDDLMVPEGIDKLVSLLDKDPLDLAFGQSVVNPLGEVTSVPLASQRIPYSLDHKWLYRKWEQDLSIPIHSALFRRKSLLDQIGPFPEWTNSKEDYYFWTVFFSKPKRFRQTKEVVAIYRSSVGSMSQSSKIMNATSFLKVAKSLSIEFPELEIYFADRVKFVLDSYGRNMAESERSNVLRSYRHA